MFDSFEEIFSCWLAYAKGYLAQGARPSADLGPRSSVPLAASSGTSHASWIAVLESRYPAIREALESRRLATSRHPFMTWLRTTGKLTATERLRRFLPMWSMDVLGYGDLNRYAFRYPEPVTNLEHAANRWVDDLQTHNVLYLRDWRALGLDEALGWNAAETLGFCYLDPWMDTHRRNIVDFVELAASHPKPALRLWLMHVMEASGEAFFRNTKAVALEAEQESGMVLDYLADRHDSVHPPTAGEPVLPQPRDEEFSLDENEVAAAVEIVQKVFDNVDEQFDLSLDAGLSNRFRIRR